MSPKPAPPGGVPASGMKPIRPIANAMQEKLDTFVEFLARTGSVSQAAEAAGLSRTLLYERRRTHKRFAESWTKALSLGVDRLHDNAMQRALEGEERQIVRGGELVATERRFNDGLMKFLLKAHKPEFSAGATTASESEQEALAKRLKAASKRLEAHRAKQEAHRAKQETSGARQAAQGTVRKAGES